MFFCCGTSANVESPKPKDEKLSVKVPDVPTTLIDRAPSLEEENSASASASASASSLTNDPTVDVEQVYKERKCTVRKSTLVNLSKGAAAVAVLATAVYCFSNTENAAVILTPVRNMYGDFF